MRSEQGSRAPFISKLDELNLATTRTTEQPARTPNKKGLSLPRRSPGADALHGPTFMR